MFFLVGVPKFQVGEVRTVSFVNYKYGFAKVLDTLKALL
jgi:hypothetical protein